MDLGGIATPVRDRGRAVGIGLRRAGAATRRIRPAHLALAVPIASIVVMSLVNFAEAAGWVVGLLFPLAYLAALALVVATLRFPALSWRSHGFAILLGALLFAPRAPYVLEPLLGYAVGASLPDDWWHVQEIAALAYTPAFPAVSTFDPDKLFNFYYALWMLPDALFKLSRGLLTVKAAFGIGALVYALMIAYFVTYAGAILFPRRGPRITAVLLLVLFAGFGSFSVLFAGERFGVFPSTAENWPQFFGFNIQWSSFVTLALWTPHHLMAGLAAIAALYVLAQAPERTVRPRHVVIAGLLFAFAAFSSAFATIGALPLIMWFAFARRRVPASAAAGVVAAVTVIPLVWLYLARATDRTGFIPFGAVLGDLAERRDIAFLLFVVLLAVQYAPLLVGAYARTRDDRSLRILLFASVGMLGSAFVLAYPGLNNYAARGLIVPLFTLTWLAAPAIHRAVVQRRGLLAGTAVALYCIGAPYSYWSVMAGMFDEVARSDTALNRQILEHNERREGFAPAIADFDATDIRWYIIENHVGQRKQVLLDQDTEIEIDDTPLRVSLQRILGIER